jgi:hypothetical protein
MTHTQTPDRPHPRGWIALAHMLVRAPARRRPEFALTEPTIFRSECFAEDLPPAPDTRARRAPAPKGGRAATLLCAVPVGVSLLGAALLMADRLA